MQDGKKPTSYTGAMSHYFGRLPGQGLKDFAEELKALNANDRAEFTEGLKANGHNIKPTA